MRQLVMAGKIGGKRPSHVTLETPKVLVIVGNFANDDREGALESAFSTLRQDDLES